MLRTLAVGWLLLAVCLLPVAGLLTSQSRAGGMACGEGRCCCEGESAAQTDAAPGPARAAGGGCCASDESPTLPPQLRPACECGGHGGSSHVAAAQVSLELPASAVALDLDLAPTPGTWDAVTLPPSRAPTPEPPPPRRAG